MDNEDYLPLLASLITSDVRITRNLFEPRGFTLYAESERIIIKILVLSVQEKE